MSQWRNWVRSTLVDLNNTIHWDRESGDKVYLAKAKVVVGGESFESRQVRLRFIGGPELDLTVADMDHLVDAYTKLRESKLLHEQERTNPQ